jgi:predicted PurR-regulated permease PerM
MDEEPADAEVPPRPEMQETTDWETVEKTKPASPPWSPQTKRAVAVGMVIFAAIVLWIARPVLSIFAIAAITAFLVAPMVRFLHRRLHWPRWLALACGYVTVVVVLLLVVGILTIGVSQSVAGFNLSDVNESMRGLATWFVETFRDFKILGFAIDTSQLTQPVEDWLQGSGSEAGGGGFTLDVGQVQSMLGGAFDSIRTAAGLIAAMVFSAVVTFMIAIYLNADSGNLYNWIHRTIPNGYQHDAAYLADRTGKVWRGYIYGQLVNSLITGFFVFVVLAAVGLPGAFLMGVIMMIFNMVPTFGPIIAAFPGVIAALVAGSTRFEDMPNWVFALIVAGIYVVVVQAQANIIAPKVMGMAVRLSPVVIMVSLIVGFNVGGLVGSLLAVPVVATAKVYIGYLYAKLLDREPFPPSSATRRGPPPAERDAPPEPG